jgi:hypothetical protein
MAECLTFPRDMPDQTLRDLIQPFEPVHIDREKNTVVIYCGKYDRIVHPIREKLRAWGATREEAMRELRAAGRKDRFRSYCRRLGLPEPPMNFQL